MAQVITLGGATDFFTILGGYWTLFPPRVRLFTNDWRPTSLDDFGNYTEAGYPGYTPVGLGNPVETISIALGTVGIRWDPVVFKPSAALPERTRIYGYLVTNFGVTQVLWAERFPYRIYFTDQRDKIEFRPSLGAASEFTG